MECMLELGSLEWVSSLARRLCFRREGKGMFRRRETQKINWRELLDKLNNVERHIQIETQ